MQSGATARQSAEAEIADIKRKMHSEMRCRSAPDDANAYATQCKTAVDAAWEVYNGSSEILINTYLELANKLRSEAFDIIDVAQFQAGGSRKCC